MTFNKAQLMVLVAATVALTACGGGSKSTHVSTTTHMVGGGAAATNPAPKETKAKIVGSLMTLKGAGDEALLKLEHTKDAPNVAAVKVGDKYVSFDVQGFSDNWMDLPKNNNNEKRIGSARGYSNDSRFGYFLSAKEGVPGTFFVQGIATEKMPATGKATYTGKAVHFKDGVVYPEASSKFDVDYGNKKITGTINVAGGSKIALSGSIDGNKFSGNKDGIGTIGHFYGNNAAELGGVYKNNTGSVGGVYGAKK